MFDSLKTYSVDEMRSYDNLRREGLYRDLAEIGVGIGVFIGTSSNSLHKLQRYVKGEYKKCMKRQ